MQYKLHSIVEIVNARGWLLQEYCVVKRKTRPLLLYPNPLPYTIKGTEKSLTVFDLKNKGPYLKKKGGGDQAWTRLFLRYMLRVVTMDVLVQSIPGASSSIPRSRINTTSLWSLFNPLQTWGTIHRPSLCQITCVTPDFPRCAAVSVWDFVLFNSLEL